MSKLKIYQYPDIVLAQKASPIQRVEKTLFSLADDMLETMYEAPGVGLAANQVGILQQILVLDTEYDITEYDIEDPNAQDIQDENLVSTHAEVSASPKITNKKPKIIINPEIIHREGSQVFTEACLSVPEYSADIKRSLKIKLRYQNIDGLTQILDAEGYMAVAIQHEMDHLDGKLFIDRLSPLKKEMVRKRLRQERLERELELEVEESTRKKAGR